MTSPSPELHDRFAWLDGVAVAATVCDRQGVCLYLNRHAAELFAKAGGRALVGTNLLACHDEPARSRFAAQLESPTRNTYTVEKNGVRKMVHQIPWYTEGTFAGVVELSFELPAEVPHFVRGSGK
jgi:transcriptional regulator with PAS, ATPase and Fis domain